MKIRIESGSGVHLIEVEFPDDGQGVSFLVMLAEFMRARGVGPAVEAVGRELAKKEGVRVSRTQTGGD